MIKNIGLIGIMVIGSCVGPCQSTQTNTAPAQPVAVTSDLQNNVPLQHECARMFREIIEVQDTREQNRVEFEKIRHAFNDGLVAREKFSVASDGWLSEENRLASAAANLYTAGRSKGCFQKVTQ
jgi:hypothetical protein